MTLVEMREQLKELTLEERPLVAETALQLIREDVIALQRRVKTLSEDDVKG